MRVLLTGFGRFPGVPFNPSAVLVAALAKRRRPALAAVVRTTHVFPTVYAAVDRELPKLFEQPPDIVLMFGVATRRRLICVETRARNAQSVLFSDASGYRPQRGVIAPGAPSTLRGAGSFPTLLAALRGRGVAARLSRDAGRYLCNYAFWRALERARGGRPLVQFVHIPPLGLTPQRRYGRRRRLPLGAAVAAAEALLVSVIAAERRRRLPR